MPRHQTLASCRSPIRTPNRPLTHIIHIREYIDIVATQVVPTVFPRDFLAFSTCTVKIHGPSHSSPQTASAARRRVEPNRYQLPRHDIDLSPFATSLRAQTKCIPLLCAMPTDLAGTNRQTWRTVCGSYGLYRYNDRPGAFRRDEPLRSIVANDKLQLCGARNRPATQRRRTKRSAG